MADYRDGDKDRRALQAEREDTWRELSKAAAIIFLIGLGVAFVLVFTGPADDQLRRIQIAAPFGVAMAAIVTYCGLMWRGAILTRQADAQQDQLARLSDQISANAENNLARLLQKGAELLGEEQKAAHVAAGIATLQAVITDSNPKFAVEAMNLVADYLQREHHTDHRPVLCRAAIDALRAGAILERRSNRSLSFQSDDERDPRWLPVAGIRRVTYAGGYATGDLLNRESYLGTIFSFEGLAIWLESHLDVGRRFRRCSFSDCSISQFEGHSRHDPNTFQGCDFSNAVIDDWKNFPDLREGGNFYRVEEPPLNPSAPPSHWETRLQAGRPDRRTDEIPF